MNTAARTTYGILHPSQMQDLAARLKGAAMPLSPAYVGRWEDVRIVESPPTPTLRLRSKKRKGKHRVYLLWIGEVFQGEFPSNKSRRAYIDATRMLEDSHGHARTEAGEAIP